jgi:SH3-like domain-containing protein
MNGQGELRPVSTIGRRLMMFLAAFSAAANAAWAAPEAHTPSGFPVPRYVSLKFQTVNARGGPGDDHRLLWVYHARSLPVQVVAENSEWRRICDPDGGLAWVHKRTTDAPRTVIRTQPRPLSLHASGKESARVVAYLRPRAIANLVKCDEKGWCKIKVDGVSGWIPSPQVWGLDEAPQCGAVLRPDPTTNSEH